MGKNRSKRHNNKDNNKENNKDNNVFDTSDDESVGSASTGLSEPPLSHETESMDSKEHELETFLDALYEKRGSTREKALSGLIDAFENRMLLGFVEDKPITLLHQFLSSIKRGSSKEASLASRAIGLLAITAGCGSIAHEIMEESVPHLHQALTSGADSLKKSSVLDCLAVISFVGGQDGEEKEKAMKIIWELAHPKSGSNVTLSKPTPIVLASAISAWSLILSTLNPWSVNTYNWQESISFLSTLLDKDDRTVRIAAGEAIALIFDVGCLDKFSTEENDYNENSDGEGVKPSRGGFSYVKSLKGKILNQVKNLSMEAGGKGSAKNDLSSQRNTFQDILALIETGTCPERPVKILKNCDPLVVSTWTQMMQLNFLRRFLGRGFLKHMQDNELLHDVFHFKPRKRENLSVKEKRMFLSPNSLVNKERTEFISKRRTWTREWKQGHYRVGFEDA
uniref:Interferon-related developmental regulator 1 n=1 Tax=Anthurium amnicola TaxID=1678845 RepID=A0A1D1ZA36_9ARAE